MGSNVRAGLLGWNGRLNAGDDAMSVMLAEAVRAADPGAALRVYADHGALPGRLRDLGATGQPFFNASLRLGPLRGLIRRFWLIPLFLRGGIDLLIIGGGSILTDRGTMANYARIARLVRRARPGARLVAAGVSVGPFSEGGEAAFVRLLGLLDAVFVRDQRSYDLTRALADRNGAGATIGHFPDPAFSVFHAPGPPVRTAAPPRRIGLVLRAGECEDEQARIVAWLGGLDPDMYRVTLIPFCAFHNGDDHAFAARLAQRLGRLAGPVPRYDGDLDALSARLVACDAIVTVRLHGLIHAVASARPVAYFAYRQKLDDIAADAGLGPEARITEATLERDPAEVLAALPLPDDGRAARLADGADGLARALRAFVGGPA